VCAFGGTACFSRTEAREPSNFFFVCMDAHTYSMSVEYVGYVRPNCIRLKKGNVSGANQHFRTTVQTSNMGHMMLIQGAHGD
jgi:hypothetical protein